MLSSVVRLENEKPHSKEAGSLLLSTHKRQHKHLKPVLLITARDTVESRIHLCTLRISSTLSQARRDQQAKETVLVHGELTWARREEGEAGMAHEPLPHFPRLCKIKYDS
jgi:hypothetical protein